MAYFNEKVTVAQDFAIVPGTDISTSGTIADLANSGSSYFRLSACTQLTSIAAPTGNGAKELTLVNINSVAMLVKNLTGTAGNQINTGLATDYSLPAGAQMKLDYDVTGAVWRITNAPASVTLLDDSQEVQNLTLVTSVSANALTIALKTKAGTDATSLDPIKIAVRDANNALGTFTVVSITSALSITVPSTATLGTVSAATENIYVYAMNNGGSIELVVSVLLCETTKAQTTIILNTSSNSRVTLYSVTARTSLPVRLIGKLRIAEATAGTWVTNASELKVLPLQDNIADSLQVPHNNGSIFVYGGLKSGLYTPTLTNISNITSKTSYVWQWMQVGQVVTVSGRFDVGATSGNNAVPVDSVLTASLPVVGANFSAATTGAAGAGVSVQNIQCLAVEVNNGASTVFLEWNATTTATCTFWLTFTYCIQ